MKQFRARDTAPKSSFDSRRVCTPNGHHRETSRQKPGFVTQTRPRPRTGSRLSCPRLHMHKKVVVQFDCIAPSRKCMRTQTSKH